MTTWRIDQKPHLKADPPTLSDWHATLKSEDGLFVLIQIDYHASEQRANEIISYFIGEKS